MAQRMVVQKLKRLTLVRKSRATAKHPSMREGVVEVVKATPTEQSVDKNVLAKVEELLSVLKGLTVEKSDPEPEAPAAPVAPEAPAPAEPAAPEADPAPEEPSAEVEKAATTEIGKLLAGETADTAKIAALEAEITALKASFASLQAEKVAVEKAKTEAEARATRKPLTAAPASVEKSAETRQITPSTHFDEAFDIAMGRAAPLPRA